MAAENELSFGPFRLDLDSEQLWRGEQVLALAPKVFALLRYLAEHSGKVMTKDELFQTVWPGTIVSDAALTVCVRELRQALGDNPKSPQYIETVHRRGYRWIASVASSQHSVVSRQLQYTVQSLESGVRNFHSAFRTPHSAIDLVGREVELEQLHGWLDKALQGERQIVFVTGEPGIGKTTLVEAFLQSLASRVPRLASEDQPPQPHTIQPLDPRHPTLDASLWLGQGQCIEHFGAGEAYLPLLAALGQLGREPGHEQLIQVLYRYAPTWLMQLPALVNAEEFAALQRQTAGATRERMLREVAEALEVLTTERPLILTLEDLHWSDPSTLELLSYLVRRRRLARLLILGTYRPIDVLADGHPLRAVTQELHLHHYCTELRLPLLTEGHVAEYLAQRFALERQSTGPLHRLASTIHQRTEGNPLFMVNVVENLLRQGKCIDESEPEHLQAVVEAVQREVPENLQQLIERQFDQLSPEEQRVLEVASVAGIEFSAAAVAVGVEAEVGTVERVCAGLTRREQFLQASGIAEWPDGTVAARYRFLHALYREVVYERVTASRRQHLHRQIGERVEQAYGEQAKEIAAELALHFEQGREYRQAIRYLQQAGENAVRRSAHQEAISLLTKGLALLKILPDTPERAQQELALQLALGTPLMATKGYAAPEVERVYTRARELCRQLEETPQLFPVLRGLWGFHFLRGELQAARELGERLFTSAQQTQDPALLIEAHYALGATSCFLGELPSARIHLEQGITLYNLHQHRSNSFLYGHDPGVACRCHAAYALWSFGYFDQALRQSQEALALAQALSHPNSLAFALNYVAAVHLMRREESPAREHAEALITLSTEQGFSHWLAMGLVGRGFAFVLQGQPEEGITQLRHGLADLVSGARLARIAALPGLAQAYGHAGQAEEGLQVVVEALAEMDKTGAHLFEAGLSVIKGRLLFLLSAENHAEAAACFQKAIDIARRQQAKSWELRAVMSLARLWQQQGKKKQAHKILAEIYNWFTEGFDTKDLQEAKALLEKLESV